GADYLVVGRPITQAADPLRTASAILEEIAGA
ncbi:MAG TPA: orotidine-5'-phosphate decarboxylase, partial [Verrucomicrobia bacterium]|nr:orotidine-5'-phosphate decarboxylase [Verrucomicrobiota bacterium]